MTETKMEVVKLMPKEYNKAEANAFKHGFFLDARSEREEVIEKATDWLDEHLVDYQGNTMGNIPFGNIEDIIKDFRKAMKK